MRLPFRADRYFQGLLRYRHVINAVALVLALASIFVARHLQLRPSFSELLPENLPSVQDFKQVVKRIGGTGLLLVGVESPDFGANRKFVDALVKELNANFGRDEIRYVEYRFDEARDYFEKYGLHYLSQAELQKLRDRLRYEIKDKAQYKKDEVFSSFLGIGSDLGDEPRAEPLGGSPPADPFAGLDPRVKNYLSYPQSYLASDDGKLLAVGISTAQSSLSFKEASAFVGKVHALVQKLEPQKYQPQMRVNFAGNVQRAIDEVVSVKHDIVDTALLLVLLTVGVLFFFFWSAKLVALLCGLLVTVLIYTFGFTQLSIGYLNTMTAFLSSLVVGTGINYGVIYISRYLEERRNGASSDIALLTSLRSTALPTLLGSMTTAASFVSLLFAQNKGFSQFGIIGGTGICLSWIMTYTLLPVWIHQLETVWPTDISVQPVQNWLGQRFATFGDWVSRRAVAVGATLAVLSVVALAGVYRLAQDPLEFDFSKLGNRSSNVSSGATALNKRIQEKVYKSSLTPAVILLNSENEAREVCPRVREIVQSLPPEQRVFQGCLGMYDLLPSTKVAQEADGPKAQLRAEIQALAGDPWLKYGDSEVTDLLRNIHLKAQDRAPTVADMPSQITRRFEEPDGRKGLLAFVFSDNKKPLEDGRNLLAYTQAFRDISLPQSGAVVHASGENFILADLLRGIRHDGPRVALLALGAVAVLAFLLTGAVRSGLLIVSCLLMGTWWFLCLQGALDLKYNFLNFIALPLTFGIGVDYPINVFLRYREQRFKDFGLVLSTTGMAVLLCTLTTMIGYATLLGASTQALVSFAQLALLGEVACILAAFVALPSLVKLASWLKRSRDDAHEEKVIRAGLRFRRRKMAASSAASDDLAADLRKAQSRDTKER